MRKIIIMILALLLLTSGCAVLPTANQANSQLEDLQADYDRLEEKFEGLLQKLDRQEKTLLQDKETIRSLKDEIKLLKDGADNNDQIEELLAIIAELQEEIEYLRSDQPVARDVLLAHFEIEALRYMHQEDVLAFFGDDYIFADIADGVPAYVFDDFIIIFDDYGNLETIFCQAVEIEGYEISLGLTFDDIQEYLGYIDVIELEQVMPDDPTYALRYDYGNFLLLLGSDEYDGMITRIWIRFL